MSYKWLSKFQGKKMQDLGFEPDDVEKYEIACQKVANMLDDPAWNWLKAEIHDQRLSWPSIFNRVAGHI